jgi:hypothetical protein
VFPLPLSLAHAATIDTFYSNNDYEYSCISKIFSPHVIFCIRYQKRKEKKRKENTKADHSTPRSTVQAYC